MLLLSSSCLGPRCVSSSSVTDRVFVAERGAPSTWVPASHEETPVPLITLSRGPVEEAQGCVLAWPSGGGRGRNRAPVFQGCLRGPLLSPTHPASGTSPLGVCSNHGSWSGVEEKGPFRAAPMCSLRSMAYFRLCVLLLVHSDIWSVSDYVPPAGPWAGYSEKHPRSKAGSLL